MLDDKVLELQEKINKARKAPDEGTDFKRQTNMIYVDTITVSPINLHTLSINELEKLLIHTSIIADKSKELGIDPLYNGFSINAFVNDISGLLKKHKQYAKEKELRELEETLSTLLSEDKKKELQLQAVEEMLSQLA